jgi:hypothetical protein
MTATGLRCLRVSVLAGGHPGFSKLTIGGIADRDTAGERVWFKSQRDAEKVLQATLSRCFEAKKTKSGITVKLPPDQVVDLVGTIAFSLGITRIKDCDVATTFDSIASRIETQIKALGREGTMKRLLGVLDFDLTGLLARQA